MDEPDMEDVLRAGVAVHNDGEYHAAHDAWEDHWMWLDAGTDDELLLHGLIQFTVAVYHASQRNWPGARGLAESAQGYLTQLPPDYRGVNLAAVLTYLRRLRADPELIERRRPLRLRVEGRALSLSDLDFRSATVAAGVLAEEYDQFDERTVERAVEFARAERAEDVRTKYISLVMDFVADEEHRELVYRRLAAQIDREIQRDEDVEGLFD
jgi:predicted metal-dependent hydrolase